MSNWHIAPLTEEHDRSRFSCGQPSLDDYLKKYAKQNEGKDFSRTFVLVREQEARVWGYYSLSAGQIERASIPPKLAKSLPKYPIPAIVLARLAVDETMKGQSLGRRLLVDSFQRCLVVGEQIGIHAVFVKAIDTGAAEFYQHFGFIPLLDSPLELYLPLATLRGALGG